MIETFSNDELRENDHTKTKDFRASDYIRNWAGIAVITNTERQSYKRISQNLSHLSKIREDNAKYNCKDLHDTMLKYHLIFEKNNLPKQTRHA